MKYILASLLLCIYACTPATPQNESYATLIRQAESLYDTKQYGPSVSNYAKAFTSNGDLGSTADRYNAACSGALAGNTEFAFSQLQRIAGRGGYTNLAHLTADADLSSLHSDPRWTHIVEMVRQNKARAEAGMDTAVMRQLDAIHYTDQHYRMQVDSVEEKHGWKSPQMQAHWKVINHHDSVNLIAVKRILDKHGWLGPDEIGEQGNTTLFLVIQHADSATQAKYLPMMRAAVAAGKAYGRHLALLEDRFLLSQGKMQVYGSQIGQNPITGAHYVQPLRDPDSVDERRAKVGLPPLANYLMLWNVPWNPEQYKKDLPAIMKLEGRN